MILYTLLTKSPLMLICSTFFAIAVCASDQSSHTNDDELPSNQKSVLTTLFKEEVKKDEALISPSSEKKLVDLTDMLFPEDIYKTLIAHTIGQDSAMKSLATFIHQHLVNNQLRKAFKENPNHPLLKEMKFEKPNILMMGPTGCGKTSSLAVLSTFLKIPFAVGNATEWTAQGYIGGKWQDVFESLVSNANVLFHTENDTVTNSTVVMDSAAHGIVFIDEIDKICNQTSEKLEVIKRVQEELLAVIQGTKLKLNNDDILDTSNILFIAGGAFPQLVSSYSIGSKDYKPITITPKKLERYGMLPEEI